MNKFDSSPTFGLDESVKTIHFHSLGDGHISFVHLIGHDGGQLTIGVSELFRVSGYVLDALVTHREDSPDCVDITVHLPDDDS